MRFRKILPSFKLQPFVKCYWFVDVDESAPSFSQHLLPYSWFQLFFHLKYSPDIYLENNIQDSNQPYSVFTGQPVKATFLSYTKPCKCVGISLQPWAGNALFDIPANHFTNRITNVDDLDKNCSLKEQFLGAKDDAEILELFESYLCKKFKNKSVDYFSADITKSILENPSVNGYKNIVSSIGFTRRRVEQRFLESTGVSMGNLVRRIRFEKALNLVGYNHQLSLTQIGLSAGYYDQSHFIREFKEFSGVTPKTFLQSSLAMDDNKKDLIIN